MSLIAEITDWLDDALKRNQIVHEIDRRKAYDFVRAGREAMRQEERIANGDCTARIWHGPGHQSRTYCGLKGEHDVHEAMYGSMRQWAQWRGEEVYSGFFDEPPRFEEE